MPTNLTPTLPGWRVDPCDCRRCLIHDDPGGCLYAAAYDVVEAAPERCGDECYWCGRPVAPGGRLWRFGNRWHGQTYWSQPMCSDRCHYLTHDGGPA